MKIIENISELFKVKSLITLSLTGVMIAMLVGAFNPPQEFVTLFCTSYGSIITYFFTKETTAESAESADEPAEPKSSSADEPAELAEEPIIEPIDSATEIIEV